MLMASGGLACEGEKNSDTVNTPVLAPTDGPILGKPIDGEGGIAAVKAKPDEAPVYELTVQKTGYYKAGEEAIVMLALVPEPTWHLNLEFPTKVQLEASEGLTLAKAELSQADATTFEEKGFEFGVHFTPSAAGKAEVKGKIKFAVCQEEACSPQSEEIEFAVLVN